VDDEWDNWNSNSGDNWGSGDKSNNWGSSGSADKKGGFNKENKYQGNKGYNKGIHVQTEEENKPRVRVVKVVDEEGFIEEKKYKMVQDDEGNDIEQEIKTYTKPEVKEVKKKAVKNEIFSNNIYEVTRYEGSYETREAELTKKTVKKGQGTLNQRENPSVQKIVIQSKISQNINKNKSSTIKTKKPKVKKEVPSTTETNNVNEPTTTIIPNPVKNTNTPKKTNTDNTKRKPIQAPKIVQPEPEVKKIKKKVEIVKKRPSYVPTSIDTKMLKKISEKTKREKKQWYETEEFQYAGIGVACFLVVMVVYSYIFSQ